MTTPTRFALLVAAAAAFSLAGMAPVAAAPPQTTSTVQRPQAQTSKVTVVGTLARRRFQIDQALAKIKTPSELKAYVSAHHGDSPLGALSPMARAQFLHSLAFGDKGGIGSFNYAVLRPLTPTQIYKILRLFGLQAYTASVGSTNIRTTGDRAIMAMKPAEKKVWGLKNYRCVIINGKKMHTCTPAQGFTCTINC